MNGLLLVNLGSAKTPTTKDVKAYLREFLGDPNVVTMPRWLWKPILNGFVLPLRSWRSATFYQDIWGKNGSPLIFYTQKITTAVQKLLPDWQVKMAMTYDQPDIQATLKEMKQAGCQKINVIKLRH